MPDDGKAELVFTEVLTTDDIAGPSRPLSQEQAKAIEHFEQGLELLQRNLLEDALQRFGAALRLDPQNRLCRANIQRIREKLKRD